MKTSAVMLLALAVTLGSASVLAAPPEGKGPAAGHGPGMMEQAREHRGDMAKDCVREDCPRADMHDEKSAEKAAEKSVEKSDGKPAEKSAESRAPDAGAAPGLQKQADLKAAQERKEAGKGSEQGQQKRAEHSRKWWRFWE